MSDEDRLNIQGYYVVPFPYGNNEKFPFYARRYSGEKGVEVRIGKGWFTIDPSWIVEEELIRETKMDTKEILKKITEKGIKEEIRARFSNIDNIMKTTVQEHTEVSAIKSSLASVKDLLSECDELVVLLGAKE